MQLFKLVISMAILGFLFNDQINAKQPEALIGIAIVLAGYLIGNGGSMIIRFSDPAKYAEMAKDKNRYRPTEGEKCFKE